MTRGKEWRIAILPMIGAMFIVGIILFCFFALRQGKETLLRSDEIRIEIRESVTDRDIQEFYIALQNLSFVDSVRYVTRENALEFQREQYTNIDTLLKEYNLENPFPDTVFIRLKSLQDDQIFRQFLEDEWQKIINPRTFSQEFGKRQEIYVFLKIMNTVENLLIFAAVFSVLTVLVSGFALMRAFVRDDPSFLLS